MYAGAGTLFCRDNPRLPNRLLPPRHPGNAGGGYPGSHKTQPEFLTVPARASLGRDDEIRVLRRPGKRRGGSSHRCADIAAAFKHNLDAKKKLLAQFEVCRYFRIILYLFCR